MATGRKSKQKRVVLDRLDSEAIRECVNTRGWKLILMRIQKMRAQAQLDLEQGHSETETADLRGYLKALRAVASIPDILIREGMKVSPGDE